jgi:hypothetical protein
MYVLFYWFADTVGGLSLILAFGGLFKQPFSAALCFYWPFILISVTRTDEISPFGQKIIPDLPNEFFFILYDRSS